MSGDSNNYGHPLINKRPKRKWSATYGRGYPINKELDPGTRIDWSRLATEILPKAPEVYTFCGLGANI
jgi:hypothetical protein